MKLDMVPDFRLRLWHDHQVVRRAKSQYCSESSITECDLFFLESYWCAVLRVSVQTASGVLFTSVQECCLGFIPALLLVCSLKEDNSATGQNHVGNKKLTKSPVQC